MTKYPRNRTQITGIHNPGHSHTVILLWTATDTIPMSSTIFVQKFYRTPYDSLLTHGPKNMKLGRLCLQIAYIGTRYNFRPVAQMSNIDNTEKICSNYGRWGCVIPSIILMDSG